LKKRAASALVAGTSDGFVEVPVNPAQQLLLKVRMPSQLQTATVHLA